MCRNLSAHSDETTKKPFYFCPVLKVALLAVRHRDKLTQLFNKNKKITHHCMLCCDWCDFQVKERKRPPEKPYSHTSDCLTGF